MAFDSAPRDNGDDSIPNYRQNLAKNKGFLNYHFQTRIIPRKKKAKEIKNIQQSKHTTIQTVDLPNNYFPPEQQRRKSEPGNFLFVHYFVVK